jgi:hypothetical protein
MFKIPLLILIQLNTGIYFVSGVTVSLLC